MNPLLACGYFIEIIDSHFVSFSNARRYHLAGHQSRIRIAQQWHQPWNANLQSQCAGESELRSPRLTLHLMLEEECILSLLARQKVADIRHSFHAT
jgi:hypothetical protein